MEIRKKKSRTIWTCLPWLLLLHYHAVRQVEAFVPYKSTFSAVSLLHASSINDSSIRPLTQNWWPVTLKTALDPSKPNPIELLDKKLVLWSDSGDTDSWSCLDDACAHRFAPLSEGRVVQESSTNKKCLQCAYHGWEFNSQGGCTRIPQSPDQKQTNKAPSIRSYPLREGAGMIWIWADPNAPPHDSPLPISKLLQRFHQMGGTARGFMRDLPYGMEYLGENLADISHLPFSHHSVMALNREDGRPVPLHVLSSAERTQTAAWQNADPHTPTPLFQARVVNASQHDPELVTAWNDPAVRARSDPLLAQSTLAFYDPAHIRYHRNPGRNGSSYEVNLFMCPTTPGKSRVFLFTPFEAILPPLKDGESKTNENENEKTHTTTTTAGWKTIVQKLIPRTKKKKSVPYYLGHMLAHSIFDGDGVFLHKQGDRMNRANLTHHDYHTPTSSDVAVNAYRRWLDRAAAVTRSMGGETVARSVLGESAYRDDRPRQDLLDRYATHTQHCPICLAALQELTHRRNRLSLATTALVGAVGASGVLLSSAGVLLAVGTLSQSPLSRALIGRSAGTVMVSAALAMVGSLVGTSKAQRAGGKLDKEIQRFHFEDYVHAEKD